MARASAAAGVLLGVVAIAFGAWAVLRGVQPAAETPAVPAGPTAVRDREPRSVEVADPPPGDLPQTLPVPAEVPVLKRTAGDEPAETAAAALEGLSIRGVYVDAGGRPLAERVIGVQARGDPSVHLYVTTDADGGFAATGLSPGTYTLQGDGDVDAAAVLDVTAGGPAVRLVLPRGNRFRFRLQTRDGVPVRPSSVAVWVESASRLQRTTGRERSSTGGVGSDFVYAVEGPGTFSFNVVVEGHAEVLVRDVVATADAETIVPVVLTPTAGAAADVAPRGR